MITELFISWRYLATKRKEKFISLISVISVLGVAIGVACLIVVIAVMNGFDKDLRDKIVGNYAHLSVAKFNGISPEDFTALKQKIVSLPHVQGVSPYVQGQVLIKEENRFFAVGIKGIEPATDIKVSRIAQYLVSGKLQDLGAESVIIGKELAAYLGAVVDSRITVLSPLGKLYNLKVAGIFSSGMYDYDLNLIFTDLKTGQEILGVGSQISAVAIKLDNMYLADKMAKEFERLLGFGYNVKSWAQQNQNFFAALELEKLTMFIILTLIILVASFNIISTLMVMAVEKTKDIGVLRAIGMSAAQVRKIFTCEGLLIGGMGIFCGTGAGIFLCWLLEKYHFIKLPQDIYYLDRLPVALNGKDIALIILAAMLITLASTLYPANKAARLEPVEALRYE